MSSPHVAQDDDSGSSSSEDEGEEKKPDEVALTTSSSEPDLTPIGDPLKGDKAKKEKGSKSKGRKDSAPTKDKLDKKKKHHRTAKKVARTFPETGCARMS